MRLILLLILIIVSIKCSYGGAIKNNNLVPKNLAGEPSEFKSFYLPNPMDVSQSSDSSLLSIVLGDSQTTNNVEWIGTIPVDSDDEFTLTFFSTFSLNEFNIETIPPKSSITHNGRSHSFRKSSSSPSVNNGTFGIDGATLPSISYTWDKPVVGEWTLKISASNNLKNNKAFNQLKDSNTPQLMVLVQNPSDVHIYSYVSSYNNLFVGSQVPVLAMLHKKSEFLTGDSRPLNWKPSPIMLNEVSAQIELSLPNGTTQVINMFDDGLHDDMEANDGLYGGYVVVSQLGNYEVQVVYKGVESFTQKSIIRSNQHLIPITTQYLELTGDVYSSQDGDANLNIFFSVSSGAASSTVDQTPVRLYSEVYGTDKDGKKVAIAWVGGISSAQLIEGSTTEYALTAVLNARWIAKVGAVAPFTVKNVIISDLTTFIPLSNSSNVANIQMIGQYKDVNTIEFDLPLHVITKEMRDGKMPSHLAERYGKATGNGKLILVHGYCSEGVWPVEDFENSVEFQDFNQNRPNDEFAQLIAAFGEQFTDGFSLVGHSQGGNAALHLLTYYHSGLDLSQAFEGRVIQSMGTPYQGTALAGTLASIGKVIGIGCSANNDLTVDGAALWLSTIPSDKRSFVYYTTTQYKTGSLVNYCNIGANGVLKWPNDGVVDTDHAELVGGTYLNNFKGWCHSDGMHSPQQTQNHDYNKELSSNSVW